MFWWGEARLLVYMWLCCLMLSYPWRLLLSWYMWLMKAMRWCSIYSFICIHLHCTSYKVICRPLLAATCTVTHRTLPEEGYGAAYTLLGVKAVDMLHCICILQYLIELFPIIEVDVEKWMPLQKIWGCGLIFLDEVYDNLEYLTWIVFMLLLLSFKWIFNELVV